jgi:hypothetical protein
MNKKFLHLLAAALATCTAIGAADLSGLTSLVPHAVAVKLALFPAIAAIIGHVILAIGDVLDDGESNGSFPKSTLRCDPVMLLLAATLGLGTLLLPSCAGVAVNAATPWGDVTTTPDGQTMVQLKPLLIDPEK